MWRRARCRVGCLGHPDNADMGSIGMKKILAGLVGASMVLAAGAAVAAEVKGAIKNMNLAGAGFPEHWFAEGGNVNRASALEMGEPTLKTLIEQGNACFAALSDEERAWVWGRTAKVLYPQLAG